MAEVDRSVSDTAMIETLREMQWSLCDCGGDYCRPKIDAVRWALDRLTWRTIDKLPCDWTDGREVHIFGCTDSRVTIRAVPPVAVDSPLDPDIAPVVLALQAHGVETFESCQGGDGHAFPEPTVRFFGDVAEGHRALAEAIRAGLPVLELRRVWPIIESEPTGPWWELTFRPHHGSRVPLVGD